MLTPHEIGYVAGVVDALGRIRTISADDTLLPRIEVSCPSITLIQRLGYLTEIKPIITRRSYDRHRCSDHCDTAHDHITSTSARWQVSGAKATVVLAAVRPHLVLQGEAADEALRIGLVAPRKERTAQKMAALGWPLPEQWVIAPGLLRAI